VTCQVQQQREAGKRYSSSNAANTPSAVACARSQRTAPNTETEVGASMR